MANPGGPSAQAWLEKGYVIPFSNRTPLQVVRWSGNRASITFAGSSLRVQIPADTVMLELTATENCYVAFGVDNTIVVTQAVNAVSRLFMAGVQIVPVPLVDGVPFSWIAAIQESTGGILQIEQVY